MIPPSDDHHVARVETLLHEQGQNHLRARKYGRAVIVESGASGDATKHLRLRRESTHRWRLDFANHRGKWEATPFCDRLAEIVSIVVTQFPWTVQSID